MATLTFTFYELTAHRYVRRKREKLPRLYSKIFSVQFDSDLSINVWRAMRSNLISCSHLRVSSANIRQQDEWLLQSPLAFDADFFRRKYNETTQNIYFRNNQVSISGNSAKIHVRLNMFLYDAIMIFLHPSPTQILNTEPIIAYLYLQYLT